MGIVRGASDVIPNPQEIDLRWILKALSCLDHGAQGANLQAIDKPGIVFASRWRFQLLHARCSISESWLNAACIHVGWLDDVGIRRDEVVSFHDIPPSLQTTDVAGADRPEAPLTHASAHVMRAFGACLVVGLLP